MEIEVKFYAMMRDISGKKTETVELPMKSSVRNLIDLLVVRYGEEFAHYIYDSKKQVKNYLSYLLNGRNIYSLQGFDTLLKSGDVFSLLPPVGGG